MKINNYIVIGYLIASILSIFGGIYYQDFRLFLLGMAILGSLVSGMQFGISSKEDNKKK